ncbi:hypothetical protein [Lewinella sp. 4G2]|uniref:hypothetical protein n=1 Tax=Lewinella sp. 4G2 TaxID=1803372 RepID=UPI0007B4D13A|nr:hypothetical protein [Lewinella sp. 4G2]OAV42748.1 hypothetical protein A3850_016035 [Lewinella sp. 4G2]
MKNRSLSEFAAFSQSEEISLPPAKDKAFASFGYKRSGGKEVATKEVTLSIDLKVDVPEENPAWRPGAGGQIREKPPAQDKAFTSFSFAATTW